jgi:acrylyl-CoA reductase (NADPH)
MTDTFKALQATESDGEVAMAFAELTASDLPDGDVAVDVAYSTLNYKDGMALNGNAGRIMRSFPMVPGIDLSGTVTRSQSPDYQVGDRVLVNGWGLGETAWGGYAQKARVKSEWLVHVPGAFDLAQAMAIGTAGFTSMLCVMALEHMDVQPGAGPVLVTGAAGGVGSLAVALLAKLGYEVAASTGRADTHDFLRGLGAATIVDRADLEADSGRPMDKPQWAGAVDTVGGAILGHVLRAVQPFGTVAACGNAAGFAFDTTVLPFILRGVSLIGVNSVFCPAPRRQEAWARLAADLPLDKLADVTTVAPFDDLLDLSKDILKGRVRGRVVIDVNA